MIKTDFLANLGFVPPETEFVRDDPRGDEYGRYGVDADVQKDNVVYTIYKYDGSGVLKFVMTIQGDAFFRRWVENTF